MELGVVMHLKIYFYDCEHLQFEHKGVVIGISKANEPKTTRLTCIYRVCHVTWLASVVLK